MELRSWVLPNTNFTENSQPTDSALADFLAAPDGLPVIGFSFWQDGRPIGRARYFVDAQRTADLDFRFDPAAAAPAAKAKAAALLVNRIICQAHPRKLVCGSQDPQIQAALAENLFYPKGKIRQRMVEPWRYLVNDRVFDAEGYIIHQGLMKSLPFGAFNSRDKGCGWIAAYNLLKLNGREHTMQEVAEALGRNAFLWEMMGQEVFSLRRYLIKEGLAVHFEAGSRYSCLRDMQNSSSGILLYNHTRGSHYTAYQTVGPDCCHFYNAVYGDPHLEMSGRAFLQKFSFLPLTMLIYVKNHQ